MTSGEHIAQAVREHLKTNHMTQSQLTGAVLSDIADRVIAHLAKVAAKKRRLATEEDWIVELEKEPHLAGVNVRKELAGCQFWCKNNQRICTRKTFINWLNNRAARVISPGGGSAPGAAGAASPKGGTPPGKGPAGWLARLNAAFPGSALAAGGIHEITAESDYQWGLLDANVRKMLFPQS